MAGGGMGIPEGGMSIVNDVKADSVPCLEKSPAIEWS